MCEKSEKRGNWAYIGNIVNFSWVHFQMNSDGFQLNGGSGFVGPSHRFCGAGSIQEGSPNSIHRLTSSILGVRGNRFIREVKDGHQALLIRLWAVECGEGTINGDREVKSHEDLHKKFSGGPWV